MARWGADTATTRVVRLDRRVDVSTAAHVRAALHGALDDRVRILVVDLSSVELIDATGLGVLVGAHRRADRLGASVLLRGVPPRVARLLRATRLSRVLRREQVAPVA